MEKVKGKAPKPAVSGDDKITILEHGIYRKGEEAQGIELKIKNVSDETVGVVLFEVVLYDERGNALDMIEYKSLGFKPDASKLLRIISSKPERNKITSYTAKLVKTIIVPAPVATDNKKLAILSHKLFRTDFGVRGRWGSDGVQLVIKNVTDLVLASAIFEAVFYDIEGNVVEKVDHLEVDIKPGHSRSVFIFPPERSRNVYMSYDVKVVRATTVDVEKVQIRRHEARTNEDGEDEFRGNIKNLSDAKADAVLVATFFDGKGEIIGTKAIIMRDIEPDDVKHFYFKFKPQEDDLVKTYTLRVVSDIEG